MELDVAPVHPDVSVVAVVGGSAFLRNGRSAGYNPQQVHQPILSVSLTINAAQQNDLAYVDDLRKNCKSYFNSNVRTFR
jgi:hypothetical protein